MMDNLNYPDDFTFQKFIGQTVTVFTISGGLSGAGFTGVLLSANQYYIRLLIQIGAAPECPVQGSTLPFRQKLLAPYRMRYRSLRTFPSDYPYPQKNCALGAIAVIPVDKITSFVHNTL